MGREEIGLLQFLALRLWRRARLTVLDWSLCRTYHIAMRRRNRVELATVMICSALVGWSLSSAVPPRPAPEAVLASPTLVAPQGICAPCASGSGEQRPAERPSPRPIVLSPTAFSQLPAGISTWLTKRSLMIPQKLSHAGSGESRQGVVKGEFEVSGQTDWAVLATDDNVNCFVLVFWAGQCPPVRLFDGPIIDQKASSRSLRVASPKFIKENLRRDEVQSSQLVEPLHDGIQSGWYFNRVDYFERGHWKQLPCSHC